MDTPERIVIIKVEDMPRYHYDVWCDYQSGRTEPLHQSRIVGAGDNTRVTLEYERGLRQAVAQARKKWGALPVYLDTWNGRHQGKIYGEEAGDQHDKQRIEHKNI